MFGLRTWTMWTETLSSTRLDTKESLCHCSGRCWEVHLHQTIDVTMSMTHVPSSLLLLRMLRPTFYSQKFASTMRFHVTATEMFFVYKHGLLCHSFIAARALATYLIPGCVGRGVRLGSESSSGATGGGVWKSGDLEIWEFGDLGIWRSGDLEIQKFGDLGTWKSRMLGSNKSKK